MSPIENENELSPLDQIRQVEAEVTRRVAAARVEAESVLAKARTQAAQIKSEARAAGQREGQALYKELVAKAEEEARLLNAQSQSRAVELRRKGYQRMEQAVQLSIQIVVGQEDEKSAQ